MRWLLVFLGLLPVAAATWRDETQRLDKCGASFAEGWRIRDRVATLSSGLDGLWLSGRAKSPMPPAYVGSLTAVADLCEKQREGALDAIAADLDAKIEDCRSRGMGRLVPVEVRTLRNADREDGWEVHYEWEAGRKMGALPVRVPGLSPATIELPPGIYVFRAKRADKSSGEVRLGVGRLERILCEIPVH